MNKSYLIFYVKGGRIGSVAKTKETITEAHKLMYLQLIQEDITGTLNFNVLGIKNEKVCS